MNRVGHARGQVAKSQVVDLLIFVIGLLSRIGFGVKRVQSGPWIDRRLWILNERLHLRIRQIAFCRAEQF